MPALFLLQCETNSGWLSPLWADVAKLNALAVHHKVKPINLGNAAG